MSHRNLVVKRAFTKPGDSVIAKITFCERPKVVYTNLVEGNQRIFILGGQSGDRYFGLVYELIKKERGHHA